MMTEDQIRKVLDALKTAQIVAVPSGKDLTPKVVTQAIAILQSALDAPDEPAGYLNAMLDIAYTPSELPDGPVEVMQPLYTHPSPKQTPLTEIELSLLFERLQQQPIAAAFTAFNWFVAGVAVADENHHAGVQK